MFSSGSISRSGLMTADDLKEMLQKKVICLMPSDAGGPFGYSEVEAGLVSIRDLYGFVAYWAGYAEALHDSGRITTVERNRFLAHIAGMGCDILIKEEK